MIGMNANANNNTPSNELFSIVQAIVINITSGII